jgi:AcrR family transcriptional regulator
MPKVLPEYLEQRRQQILDAAAACFARGGFHQTTMQDICDEAGLSPGAVYRYFHSKEEIIEGMCERGRAENTAIIEAAFENDETLAILDELIRVFFGNLSTGEPAVADCALSVELISEAPRNEFVRESLRRNNDEVRSRFIEKLVLRAQARGEMNPNLSPEAIARVMIAVYHGFLTQKIIEPELDVWGYAEVLRSLFGGTFWRATPVDAVKNEQVFLAAAALRH